MLRTISKFASLAGHYYRPLGTYKYRFFASADKKKDKGKGKPDAGDNKQKGDKTNTKKESGPKSKTVMLGTKVTDESATEGADLVKPEKKEEIKTTETEPSKDKTLPKSEELPRPILHDPEVKEKIKAKMAELENENKAVSEEWTRKFDDECFKFEKEWKKIAEDKEQAQDKYLGEELNEASKAKVMFLVDKLMDLNLYEMRFLSLKLKQKIMRGVGINPMKLNLDWPSMKQLADGTWPPMNPNWFKQQEIMAKLGPFLGTLMPQQGFAQAPAAPAAKKEESKESIEKIAKEMAKHEKTIFNIQCTGYDQSNKIKLLKEYRAVEGLGLKEVKERVDKVPFIMKKDLRKDEAEEYMKKFQALCKMELVQSSNP